MYGMNTYNSCNEGYSSSYNASAQYKGGSQSYSSSTNYAAKYQSQSTEHAESIVETFLEDERPATALVSSTHVIMPVIEQTFELITGQEFPTDSIQLSVVDFQTLKRVHEQLGGAWNNGIMGFSINKYGRGVSEIFVREEQLDSLLLTIGHELGHVLGPSLSNKKDEEAKAHAFSIVWMETIRDNNICGLKPNIRLNPAKNGLHDVAYDFVQHLLKTGASAFDVFKTLAHGLTSIIVREEFENG